MDNLEFDQFLNGNNSKHFTLKLLLKKTKNELALMQNIHVKKKRHHQFNTHTDIKMYTNEQC